MSNELTTVEAKSFASHEKTIERGIASRRLFQQSANHGGPYVTRRNTMPTALTEWKPNEELTAVDVAFPASVSHLMPPYSDIPEDFRSMNSQNRWTKFQEDWFFKGLKDLKLSAKDGIDATKAMRHLGCINGSFEPKHQHKRAAVAYLASLWFDDIKYETAK